MGPLLGVLRRLGAFLGRPWAALGAMRGNLVPLSGSSVDGLWLLFGPLWAVSGRFGPCERSWAEKRPRPEWDNDLGRGPGPKSGPNPGGKTIRQDQALGPEHSERSEASYM